MDDRTIKAEDRAGNVIEMRIKRMERRGRQFSGDCVHHKITVDPTLNTVHCLDCDKEIHAAAWIAMLADHWDFMRYTTKKYREALDAMEDRKRCTCQHCGKVTKIVRHRKNVIPYTGIVYE